MSEMAMLPADRSTLKSEGRGERRNNLKAGDGPLTLLNDVIVAAYSSPSFAETVGPRRVLLLFRRVCLYLHLACIFSESSTTILPSTVSTCPWMPRRFRPFGGRS